MIRTRIGNRSDTSWWAALGAPLVGVPLLVALLAITAPGEPAAVLDGAVGTVEALDVVAVEAPIGVDGCGEGSALFEG